MSDQFSMFGPMTSEASSSATSSPALEFGVTPCDSQAGPMIENAGRAPAPAQVSAPRAKAKGLTTLVTSGRSGIASSASVALEQSLVSRLQRRLDMAGSTLFAETWKRRSTPLRRRYWEHTASGRRTSGSDCTSVPTPNTPSGGPNSKSTATHTGGMDLDGVVTLAAVPTHVRLPSNGDLQRSGNNDYSRKIVELASVPTPDTGIGPHGRRGQSTNRITNRRETWKRRCLFGSHPISPRLERHFGDVRDWRGPGWLDPHTARSVAEAGATRGFWADCDWWHARDGKYRPIEPGIFPLAHGVANRVLKLRGYGDAINAEVAAEFIKTAAESIDERQSTRHHLSCAR